MSIQSNKFDRFLSKVGSYLNERGFETKNTIFVPQPYSPNQHSQQSGASTANKELVRYFERVSNRSFNDNLTIDDDKSSIFNEIPETEETQSSLDQSLESIHESLSDDLSNDDLSNDNEIVGGLDDETSSEDYLAIENDDITDNQQDDKQDIHQDDKQDNQQDDTFAIQQAYNN